MAIRPNNDWVPRPPGPWAPGGSASSSVAHPNRAPGAKLRRVGRYLPVVRRVLAAILLAAALAGCGESVPQPKPDRPPGDPQALRAIERIWSDLRAAARHRDAEAICRHLLSRKAADNEAGYYGRGGTCEKNVRRSDLLNGTIHLSALSQLEVRRGAAAAAGQYRRGASRPYSVQFVFERGRWRVHQLFRRFGY